MGIVDISTKSEHISRKYKISMSCISTFTAGSLYLNTHWLGKNYFRPRNTLHVNENKIS